ncbi:MAG: SusC/RagA family TonB-linked outer membrane protein [Chitinophagaceae bacterium]
MRKFFCLLLCTFLVASYAGAQSRPISGRVTDEKNTPVANASVIVKGTKIGATTNTAGEFTLSVPANATTLVISSVNFEPSEVPIGSNSTVNVSLKTPDAALQEVVVVGYGTGRKVGTVVGSVATVNAEKVQDRPAANAFDALQGKVAGLQVYTSSGEPSQLSTLRLHGVGSLGANSTPLYVMDGIPVAQATIINLNPNDFESISILKDASATSIYGSRAANGVVFITTKRGSTNKPATITLQTQHAVSALANTDFFNRFMNAKQLSDFFVASGYRTQAQMDATLTQYPNDYKWLDAFYRDRTPTDQVDLSISGGGGKTSYFVSGGYFNQKGLAYRSGFKRYTMRTNIASQINNWVKFGGNLFFGSSTQETNPYNANSLGRGLGLLAPPWFSPIDPATGEQYYGTIPGWGNNSPRYLEEKSYGETNNVQFNPSGFITLTPFKGLTLKTQAGIEFYDNRTTSGNLPSLNNTFSGSTNEAFARGVTKTITNTGEYKFDIGADHQFTALIGHEFIDDVATTIGAGSSGQSDDRLILLNQGTTGFTAGSSKIEFSYLSYFSRIEYNFMNRYFLDASFRQDQSSRFGVDNRTANFWAIGAMWKAKDAAFFADKKWLSDLNFKISYGTQGNSAIPGTPAVANYQSQALVGTTSYANLGGFAITQPGNPLLGWESQSKLTIGTNFSLWNRARFNVEFYNRVTEDMLVSVPYPFTSGFTSNTENVGSLKNTGFDFTFDADVLNTKDAYITPYFNLNYNTDKVTELFQGKEYWITPNTGVLWAVGKPVSYSYPIFAGVNPQNGNPEWYLPDTKIMETRKDGAAVTSAFSAATLEQNTGIKRNPPLNGGFGTTAGYKGFFMSADFSFSKGKFMINNDRYFFENPRVFTGYNQFNTVNDFWKQPGDIARFPRVGVTNWTQFDSRLIEDASFMRLKAFTIGYNFPRTILNRTSIVKAAKFYVTGRNLLTWTKYTGPDPEVDLNLGLGTNPNTKQVAVGLDITF